MTAKVLPADAQSIDDFFNSNVVHEIRIEIDPANWQTLKTNYLLNTYYPCDMVWRVEGRDVPLGRVGIRQRGTGSRSPIKPGLGVDITRYVPNQTFLGLKAFVLRNNSQDASMMHEIVSMALMRCRSTHEGTLFYERAIRKSYSTVLSRISVWDIRANRSPESIV